MINKEKDLMDIITDTFYLAKKVKEDYLKKGPYPELSLTEINVIEAVSKEQFPTMGAVADRLRVTVGTLTTNVKSIIKKGFLTKERYEKDHRFTILSITQKGYEALAVHNEFAKTLSDFYAKRMTDEQFNWVQETFLGVQEGLKDYREELLKKD
ncbi:MarR family winged helix-turn-helix transcriptional regulator [Kandleria sp.]|uniref:MarR family winged helix-turn-helix transcriptional regulator n=1 Tax=Kandleria sp. TaxID=2774291 RepID=UPI001B5CA98C|nr:MarR family winged helix-turn-helix transcriptional regulator [Kandleria sp.]MBP3275863.1 winged helix-turn-helix transcriptional regulator [Kandleria sp.]